MPGKDFFARMGPEFAQQAGSARENADRQADVERLIAKAEYDCIQLRRELSAVMAGAEPPVLAESAAALAERTGEVVFTEPAKAA